MSYELDQFITDCKTILARDPGPTGREEVRLQLERLLGNAEFVQRHCGEDVPQGLKTLYEDPKLGFQILAHINNKGRAGEPHDHGKSWAIYGQATKYTDMTEWERVDDGRDPKHAKLKQTKQYRLNAGRAGIFQDGAIHAINYPDQSRFVRVTGTNLDKITRARFNLQTGEIHQMTPQLAT